MSRVRPIKYGDKTHWFDTRRNNDQATLNQLELLADVKGISLDDILDEPLTQSQVLDRIREEINPDAIPAKVLAARRARRAAARKDSECRICHTHGLECEGLITRHHFVPRWLMLELENYASYAARTKCTIPICLSKHRDLHTRGEGWERSVVPYLNVEEREFAQKLLNELKEQHSGIYELILAGDESITYEARLLYDYSKGLFRNNVDYYAASKAWKAAS